jgi:peptidyl-prolyl cis-trans isomerase C
MLSSARLPVAVLVAALACTAVGAQTPAPAQTPPAAKVAPPPPAPPPSTPEQPPPPPTAVAATVNGQPIPELAVYRALLREPPARRVELRTEALNFLIENALIDQYLEQLKVAVEAKDVEERFQQVKKQMLEAKVNFEDLLKKLHVTEADLRAQIVGALRFDNFVTRYATDKALHEFFDANRAMFDGSQVKARHILLTAPAGDAKAAEQARAKLLGLKKQIEDQVAGALKVVPPGDKLALEKARIKVLGETFAAVAAKESACRSKSAGGELGWFPRAGLMVEPFAKAAFALKPHELSDVVATEFGLHLILVTDVKPGREVQYEKLKEVVKEVYADRLREMLVSRLRPPARIVINQPAAAAAPPGAPAGKR